MIEVKKYNSLIKPEGTVSFDKAVNKFIDNERSQSLGLRDTLDQYDKMIKSNGKFSIPTHSIQIPELNEKEHITKKIVLPKEEDIFETESITPYKHFNTNNQNHQSLEDFYNQFIIEPDYSYKYGLGKVTDSNADLNEIINNKSSSKYEEFKSKIRRPKFDYKSESKDEPLAGSEYKDEYKTEYKTEYKADDKDEEQIPIKPILSRSKNIGKPPTFKGISISPVKQATGERQRYDEPLLRESLPISDPKELQPLTKPKIKIIKKPVVEVELDLIKSKKRAAPINTNIRENPIYEPPVYLNVPKDIEKEKEGVVFTTEPSEKKQKHTPRDKEELDDDDDDKDESDDEDYEPAEGVDKNLFYETKLKSLLKQTDVSPANFKQTKDKIITRYNNIRNFYGKINIKTNTTKGALNQSIKVFLDKLVEHNTTPARKYAAEKYDKPKKIMGIITEGEERISK